MDIIIKNADITRNINVYKPTWVRDLIIPFGESTFDLDSIIINNGDLTTQSNVLQIEFNKIGSGFIDSYRFALNEVDLETSVWIDYLPGEIYWIIEAPTSTSEVTVYAQIKSTLGKISTVKSDSIMYEVITTDFITFEDPNVKAICVNNWGSDGEITYAQAAAVTDLGNAFYRNQNIYTFNELQYFTGLTSLYYSEVNDGCFYDCINLQSVTIPNLISTLGKYAFMSCLGLISIIIPSTLSLIDEGAFEECRSLTYINIPNSITVIEDWAFYMCTGLSSILIPSSVTSIGSGAFYECSGLTTINCLNPIPPTLGSDIFTDCPNLTNIYVPAESVNIYKTAPGWSPYTSIISTI